jgi:formamidopyrimidine-DNA glycosylase
VPELPEVETVRRGLVAHLEGRLIDQAWVHHPRAARRHDLGPAHLEQWLRGRRITAVDRRGKYLWCVLDAAPASVGSDVLVAHLGMSGQFRVTDERLEAHPHLRLDLHLDDGRWLSFLDQRTFGGVAGDVLALDSERVRAVPTRLAHLGADPFEPVFDARAAAGRIRRRHTEVKRALLDQTLVSGIGNIYADESLWRARVHPRRVTDRLSRAVLTSVLDAARDVMSEALENGGTSFDALYVDVNGSSGYFERSLDVYGREDAPCHRCGTPVRRLSFMNRSSYVCPRCQRGPRATTGAPGTVSGVALRRPGEPARGRP